MCSLNRVEDQYHFLIECDRLSDCRNHMWRQIRSFLSKSSGSEWFLYRKEQVLHCLNSLTGEEKFHFLLGKRPVVGGDEDIWSRIETLVRRGIAAMFAIKERFEIDLTTMGSEGGLLSNKLTDSVGDMQATGPRADGMPINWF